MTVATPPREIASPHHPAGHDLREQRALRPNGFEMHRHVHRATIAAPRATVWAWLNDPVTFVDGQPWPFRVEFVGGGFADGVVCNHHGPLLNLPGVLADLDAPRSRSLHYLYGSYAVSPRWIRPVSLYIKLRETDDGSRTEAELQLDSWVRPWIAGLWTQAQRLFWRGFGWSARRGIKDRAG